MSSIGLAAGISDRKPGSMSAGADAVMKAAADRSEAKDTPFILGGKE